MRSPTLRINHLQSPRRISQSISSLRLPLKRNNHTKTGQLLYPEPPTTQHSCLKSFLAYADRTGLAPDSTVYVGTRYEYIVGSALARYGMLTRRVGGASDYGIDLLGTWELPTQPGPLRVIVQCKAGSRRTGPSMIRELEGSFVGAPVGWRGSRVLGFLVAEQAATKGIRDSLGRSKWPMGYISCSKDGLVQQMIWNRSAEGEGLEGIGVGLRYATGDDGESGIVLTEHGKHIPLLDPSP